MGPKQKAQQMVTVVTVTYRDVTLLSVQSNITVQNAEAIVNLAESQLDKNLLKAFDLAFQT